MTRKPKPYRVILVVLVLIMLLMAIFDRADAAPPDPLTSPIPTPDQHTTQAQPQQAPVLSVLLPETGDPGAAVLTIAVLVLIVAALRWIGDQTAAEDGDYE